MYHAFIKQFDHTQRRIIRLAQISLQLLHYTFAYSSFLLNPVKYLWDYNKSCKRIGLVLKNL